jgi:hypothetical protein
MIFRFQYKQEGTRGGGERGVGILQNIAKRILPHCKFISHLPRQFRRREIDVGRERKNVFAGIPQEMGTTFNLLLLKVLGGGGCEPLAHSKANVFFKSSF